MAGSSSDILSGNRSYKENTSYPSGVFVLLFTRCRVGVFFEKLREQERFHPFRIIISVFCCNLLDIYILV
jgi:hypothetical protein